MSHTARDKVVSAEIEALRVALVTRVDPEIIPNARRIQLLDAEQHEAKAIAALTTMRADFASAYDELLPRLAAGIMACDSAIAAINASRAARGQPAIGDNNGQN